MNEGFFYIYSIILTIDHERQASFTVVLVPLMRQFLLMHDWQ